MTIFKIGDVVQIKRTSGNLTSATIFKISENDLEVTWLENHRKIGKKIYKNEVISNISQLRTSRSKTTIFFNSWYNHLGYIFFWCFRYLLLIN